jgi:hypothetical protein
VIARNRFEKKDDKEVLEIESSLSPRHQNMFVCLLTQHLGTKGEKFLAAFGTRD